MNKSKYDITDSDIINEAYENIYNENIATIASGIAKVGSQIGKTALNGIKTLTPKVMQFINTTKAKIAPALFQLKSQFGNIVNELGNVFESSPDYNTAVNNMNNISANNPQVKPTLDTIINSVNALQLSDDKAKLEVLKQLMK